MTDKVELTSEERARIERIAACNLDQQRRVAAIALFGGAVLLLFAVVQLATPHLAIVEHGFLRWLFLVLSMVILFLGVLRFGYYMLFRLIKHLAIERERLAAQLGETRAASSSA